MNISHRKSTHAVTDMVSLMIPHLGRIGDPRRMYLQIRMLCRALISDTRFKFPGSLCSGARTGPYFAIMDVLCAHIGQRLGSSAFVAMEPCSAQSPAKALISK